MPLMDYRCYLCGHKHRQEEKPERCARCGHTLFWAVPAPPPGFLEEMDRQGEEWPKKNGEGTKEGEPC